MDEEDFFSSLNSTLERLQRRVDRMRDEDDEEFFTLDNDMSGVVGPFEDDDVWPANVGYSGAFWEDEQKAFNCSAHPHTTP